jgi:hypothetical protein
MKEINAISKEVGYNPDEIDINETENWRTTTVGIQHHLGWFKRGWIVIRNGETLPYPITVTHDHWVPEIKTEEIKLEDQDLVVEIDPQWVRVTRIYNS